MPAVRCRRAASIAVESSAWTIISAPYAASSPRSSSSCSGDSGGNSSTPESGRKHLKPKTPASCSARRSPGLPGIAPPQKPTSTKHLAACGGLPLDLAAPATSVVGGMQLSGMSMIVVTPPAAAARVAVAKPSHSVRPGSLTCTWVSTRPGSSTSSSASSRSRAAGRSASYAGQTRRCARPGRPRPGSRRSAQPRSLSRDARVVVTTRSCVHSAHLQRHSSAISPPIVQQAGRRHGSAARRVRCRTGRRRAAIPALQLVRPSSASRPAHRDDRYPGLRAAAATPAGALPCRDCSSSEPSPVIDQVAPRQRSSNPTSSSTSSMPGSQLGAEHRQRGEADAAGRAGARHGRGRSGRPVGGGDDVGPVRQRRVERRRRRPRSRPSAARTRRRRPCGPSSGLSTSQATTIRRRPRAGCRPEQVDAARPASAPPPRCEARARRRRAARRRGPAASRRRRRCRRCRRRRARSGAAARPARPRISSPDAVGYVA